MAAPTLVGNVLKYTAVNQAQPGPVSARGILIINLKTSAQTVIVSETDSPFAEIFAAKLEAVGLTTAGNVYLDFGDSGFRFENGLKLTFPSADVEMYVFRM